MTETLNSLQHKMASAGDLQTVVRAMKAMAAANISQYEQAVTALANYDNTLTQALGACLRERARLPQNPLITATVKPAALHVIVFGSDQGLVGQFNDAIVSYTLAQLALPTLAHLQQTAKWWVVGERAQMLAPAMMMPILMAAAGLVGEARDALFGFYDEDQDPVERVIKAFSRGTPLAPVDPFINWVSGARYQRSALESFVGPGTGSLARSADAFVALVEKNSPNNNNAERKAAKAFYGLVVEPSVNILLTYAPNPAAAAATQYVGSQKAKNTFADVFAGKEQKKDAKPFYMK